MVVTNAVGPLLGDLTCGTLLQKKSWMKLVRAMSKSVLFTRVKFNRLPSPECLVYKNFSCDISSNGDDSDRLHKVLEFVSTVHDLCEDEVNSEDEYEENTDQWTWGYLLLVL
ncbi:unnamed protein product [Brassica rapa]|uniref:Uncharacterized protein n=1 Tax=Brassica campestris TaxID=3711 RepID=A0A8D9M9V6_BRACM|nr:unnamed protein product [Brassica rapa]